MGPHLETVDEGRSLSDSRMQPVTPQERRGLRVLIVDDHAGFRAAARDMLAAAGLDVVGEAAGGWDALAQAGATVADVVLLDVGLPDIDGFDVCARLAVLDIPPAVILTSSRDASEYRDRLAASAARGFIPKYGLSAEAIIAMVG